MVRIRASQARGPGSIPGRRTSATQTSNLSVDSSMVRIRAFQARGPGSIPGRRTSAHLAQTVERWPFKPMVVGSIPTVGVTNKTRGLSLVGHDVCLTRRRSWVQLPEPVKTYNQGD